MKFHFITLGCPKNRVDSEVMFGSLLEHFYEYTDEPQEAELIVVNSCAFIQDAKKESIDTILEVSEFKKTGKLKKLVVAGCLAQRYQKEIEVLLPEVDHFIGTGEYYKIASIVESEQRGNYSIPSYIHAYDAPRINSMPFYTAYLKITEGCNRKCGFCIIPTMRGLQKSQSIENLQEEAQRLVALGVRELNLIGQDLTSYGTDLKDAKTTLSALLKKLVTIKDLKWIRLLYCYPDKISSELIEFISSEEKICKYLDLPLQHIHNDILQSMRRGVNQTMILNLIDELRNRIDKLTLRTSFMTGYPGESAEHFETLYGFVKQMEFDHVGVFTYSQEEGTHAETLKGQIDQKVKEKRKEKLMMVQSEISRKHHQKKVGSTASVLIENWQESSTLYQGRYEGQAPDIDGHVYVASDKALQVGQFYPVRFNKAYTYDLKGTISSGS
ncbi:MAG: 30S ribosomal protein S12 methylthiotransferase RimO [Deltaproteobacteria bacterium]|nr:30S ribosomal protein S12 methylthiotransferase RimO [Deltaproteobacteria bacterium]